MVTRATRLAVGTLWRLELTVPPGEGHFPYSGRVCGLGEILRIDSLPPECAESSAKKWPCGVAVRFCDPLELHFYDR